MKVWKLTALAAMVAGLSACGGEDGNDGAQGPAGPQGPQGEQGEQGEQAPSNEDNSMSISILHMNDHHSHLEAESFGFDVSELGFETGAEDIPGGTAYMWDIRRLHRGRMFHRHASRFSCAPDRYW